MLLHVIARVVMTLQSCSKPARGCPASCFYKLYGSVTILLSLKQSRLRMCGLIAAWLEDGSLQRLVLVISSAVGSKEVLERWTFVVETDKAVVEGG